MAANRALTRRCYKRASRTDREFVMQVQPGFSLLQALSGGLQPRTAKPQANETVQPVQAVAPKARAGVPAEASTLPQAGFNMNAPRGTYLNIRV